MAKLYAWLPIKGAYYYRDSSGYRSAAHQFQTRGAVPRIKLVPEPTNRHDKYAIRVIGADCGTMFGFVPKEDNQRILKLMASPAHEVFIEFSTTSNFNLHALKMDVHVIPKDIPAKAEPIFLVVPPAPKRKLLDGNDFLC